VSLEEVVEAVRVGGLGVDKDELDDEDFRLATRWAVAGVMADICIGGNSRGLGFLGSVEDNVCNEGKPNEKSIVKTAKIPCPASYPSLPRYGSHYDPYLPSSVSLSAFL
jgi:hypothetical protein